VAEKMMVELASRGIEYVFGNLSTGSLVFFNALDRLPTPKLISCLHEFVAVSAAHGYAVASGQVSVVFLGDITGPLSAAGAVFNANISRTPILILSGRIDSRMRYRFVHDLGPPSEILGGRLKHDFELLSPEKLGDIINIALRTALTDPKGPVAVYSYRDVLSSKTSSDTSSATESNPPRPPSADEFTRKRIVQALLAAEKPVVLTGYLGRNPSAVKTLVNLADALALPVIELGYGANAFRIMNFPTDHPLHLGFGRVQTPPELSGPPSSDYLSQADAILLIDCLFPSGLPKGALTLRIDFDSHLGRELDRADIDILADSAVELPQLLELVNRFPKNRDRISSRFDYCKSLHDKQRKEWMVELRAHLNESPISPWRIAFELNSAKDEDTVIVHESVSAEYLREVYRRNLTVTKPGTWFSSIGGFLGWSTGAGIGIKLARPNCDVAVVVGDGSFVYGNGHAALWTAKHYRIPVLYIVENNSGYAIERWSFRALAGEQARQDCEGADITEPLIDFTALADSVGVSSRRVVEAQDLGRSLKWAFEILGKGDSALLDVVTMPIR